jgi:hypothetical protein
MTSLDENLAYLRKKLETVRPRALTRYKYYDMKKHKQLMGLTIPPALQQQYMATVGWCSKAVDTLADRLVFRGFADDNFDMSEIFRLNNPDIFFDSAVLSALITSCCFVYISKGQDSFPRLQVIQGTEATGKLDPVTGLLQDGYAVLKRNESGHPTDELYFEAGATYHIQGKDIVNIEKTNVPYPLLVPIIHRPDAVRPFGRSRISRSAIYYQEYASRTLERSDVTAEFYSFPQKYAVGMSQDAEPMETWKATVSSFLQFTKDEDGDSPTLGQFSVPSMSPFTEQLRTAASGFAGETGLTLDDLGFVSDNPSSAEAIKASHETLRLMAEKAQRNFGTGFLNVGYLASCLRDNYPYRRNQFYLTTPKWQPAFKADAATLSLVGDGAIKLNQAVPGYMDGDTLEDLTGVKGANET